MKLGMGRRDYGLTDAEKAEAEAIEAERLKRKRRKQSLIALALIVAISVLGWVLFPEPEPPKSLPKPEKI